MPETIAVREVLRLLWEADSYPRIGNADWPQAARMEAAALAKAATAVAAYDDPLAAASLGSRTVANDDNRQARRMRRPESPCPTGC